jgi:hypothetical protein
VFEEEIQSIILNAPKEKALRPDGFIGLFFSHCWNIIKEDLMQAIEEFLNMNYQGLKLLNVTSQKLNTSFCTLIVIVNLQIE